MVGYLRKDEDLIADLENDIMVHECAAERLEEDARHRRKMAKRARAALAYIRKQQCKVGTDT